MISEITYFCKIDKSMQPAMFRKAKSAEPRPLLVALHTWSHTHTIAYQEYANACEQNDWNMIFPEFRGPNWTQDACGSDFVVSDIEDAVAFMKKKTNVDPNRIYLCGGSGGGHCALLMAGRRPDLWTAVSAWCPISDIAQWYKQCLGSKFKCYSENIIKSCDGNPFESPAAARECLLRSPLTWLPNAVDLPVDISTGIHDGHIGSVPVSQALNAFNVIAHDRDKISAEDIEYIVKNESIPSGLAKSCRQDPSLGRKIHFRRQSGNARITLFEGEHECLTAAAVQWLAKQVKGKTTDWSAGKATKIKTDSKLSG